MLRQATAADAPRLAEILTAARAKQAWFPPLHTPEEDAWFVHELLLPQHEVWVAEEHGIVLGFAALKDDVLGHLFVHPDTQGRGVGTELLDLAKRERPGGFTLWTHQASEARAFYEKRGLTAVELTDGATTMEKLPDVRYAWTPGSGAR